MVNLHYHLSSICIKLNEINPLCREFTKPKHTLLPIFSSGQIFILYSSLKIAQVKGFSLVCDILCFSFLISYVFISFKVLKLAKKY